MEPQEQDTPKIDYSGIFEAACTEWTTLKRKQSMLAELLQSPAGRMKLATSLGPCLYRRKYEMGFASSPSIQRQDSTIIRHLDDIKLLIVNERGDILVQSNHFGYRIQVPVFAVCANPMFPVQDVRDRRFDLVARCLNLAKAELGTCENGYILALFDQAAQLANEGTLDGNKDIPWTKDFFEAAEETFKRRGLTMKSAFVHPKSGGVEMCKQLEKPMEFCTERPKLIRGILGYKNGVEIRQSRVVDPAFMYFTGEKISEERGRSDLGLHEYTKSIHAAYIIEERKLVCAAVNCPKDELVGFNLSEEIGFAANPVAVQRVAIDQAVVDRAKAEPMGEGTF